MVPSAVPTLAEAFRDAGYARAAFVSGSPLESAFGLDRGFEVYDDTFSRNGEGERERPAAATAAAFTAWLPSARRPWFAWVHFYDPHYPYEPPARLRREGRRGAYDGEVAYVDEAVGTLLLALRTRGGPRLVDIAPTLLRLAGLPPLPGPLNGVSLDRLLAGEPARPEPAYLETQQPWLSYGWSPLRAVRHGGWKLVEAPRPELYDLGADPSE